MKSIMIGLVLLAGGIWADEVADRAAVERTILSLNTWPVRPGLFTADFDNQEELARVAQARIAAVCPEVWRETCGMGIDLPGVGTVIISKEPWGEATISMPGSVQDLRATIVVNRIRLITPEVAMVDAIGSRPALIVLRKEGTVWKIASLRMLASATVVTAI